MSVNAGLRTSTALPSPELVTVCLSAPAARPENESVAVNSTSTSEVNQSPVPCLPPTTFAETMLGPVLSSLTSTLVVALTLPALSTQVPSIVCPAVSVFTGTGSEHDTTPLPPSLSPLLVNETVKSWLRQSPPLIGLS